MAAAASDDLAIVQAHREISGRSRLERDRAAEIYQTGAVDPNDFKWQEADVPGSGCANSPWEGAPMRIISIANQPHAIGD
jgi:hypothetical protein